jgi:hypothetical protein
MPIMRTRACRQHQRAEQSEHLQRVVNASALRTYICCDDRVANQYVHGTRK